MFEPQHDFWKLAGSADLRVADFEIVNDLNRFGISTFGEVTCAHRARFFERQSGRHRSFVECVAPGDVRSEYPRLLEDVQNRIAIGHVQRRHARHDGIASPDVAEIASVPRLGSSPRNYWGGWIRTNE